MKKTCFIIVCIMMGVFTAFGQAAVSAGTDSEIITEQVTDRVQTDTEAVQLSQEDAATQPQNDTPPVLSADNDGVAETVAPATVSANEASQPSKTETVVISTGQSDSDTQEHKDIIAPVEVNEPTQRTKRRALSMHTGLLIAATGANNAFSFFDFFKPELVIDLNTLSQKTIKSGLHAGVLFNFYWFFQFKVLEEHTVKIYTTVNADGWTNV